MAEHAPAPCEIEPYVDAIGDLICQFSGRHLDLIGMPPENARLLRAAPALLAACEGMLYHIDNVLDDQDLMQRRAALVAAIAEAKGDARGSLKG